MADLTSAELERLALLLEEMGEAQQIIGKILRFGYESFHPKYPQISNRELLTKELGHVWYAVHLMAHLHDLEMRKIEEQVILKADTISQWLHHQPE